MSVGKPVQVRLQDDELCALDSYRRAKLNPPSRGRALRELARIALLGSGSHTASSTSEVVEQQ
jgi:hypothetical protein